MIRYSNRFKAGTRRNKHWARSDGKDACPTRERERYECGFTKEPCSRRINPGKPNHAARVANVDWKAIRDAEKAEKLIQDARRKEDEEADTSTMEGAKEYMEKVLERKATIEPGHI